jgi:hypothetical protein
MITTIFEPPKPEKDAAGYNPQRLRQGLKYADAILRNPQRRLSPLGESALILYKDAIVHLLDHETTAEIEDDEDVKQAKSNSLSLIRMHEEAIQFRSHLHLFETGDAQELQAKLLELMKLQFYARYGDAFADVCNRIRAEAESKKVLGWQTLCGDYWTDINKKLMSEKPAYNEILAGADSHALCQTHMAISEVCLTVGFHLEETLSIISLYATRNEIVHADLQKMVKEGRFDDLKKRLSEDLSNLEKAISSIEGVQLNLMQKLLNGMIDRWFTKNPIDEANIQLWIPTQDLQDLFTELNAGNGTKVFGAVQRRINVEVARRLQDEVMEDALVDDLNRNFGLITGNHRVQRVASSEHAEELKKSKKRVLEWKKLNDMAYGVRVKSQEYEENWGALERTPTIMRDHTLD